MENCPHCIEFKPVWKRFTDEFKKSKLASRLCITDISAENDALIDKYKITTFPSLLLFNNNSASQTPIQFDGEKTRDGLMTFITQNVA